jgi:hypothetical protein
MNYLKFRETLKSLHELNFVLPNGNNIPTHFHITEVGLITKHFIDCGGTERSEKLISFQIWVAEDLQHRLTTDRLIQILDKSAKITGNANFEIEIEYQTDTIGKYGVSFNGGIFQLQNKYTQCLAADSCGTNSQSKNIQTSNTIAASACCTPGGGCC